MSPALKHTALLVGATLFGSTLFAVEGDSAFNVLAKNSNGQPTFVSGNLASTTDGDVVNALKGFMAKQSDFGLVGNEGFKITREWTDELGKTHTHLEQTINGLKVYGAAMIVHTEANAAKNGQTIYAISGQLATDNDPMAKSVIASLQGKGSKADEVIALAKQAGDLKSKPELSYVYVPELDQTKMAWRIEVKYDTADGFEHDVLFLDANNLTELARHPLVHRAKSYRTYTHNNRAYNDSSQRQLWCTNSESCPDTPSQNAHTGASRVYDYYSVKHGRDSINNSGMTMNSNVHVGSNWNNAVWYNNQMYYGEGDGTTFTDLTGSFDVIAHELTHGVTQYTANLVYQNESGALNEAMSDIMGVAAKAYRNGQSIPSWKVGAEVYTPGTSGDALRYMDNPTQDGQSYDYYPERYTGTQDYGGVHLNSGIGNLAFVLAVQGGKHPRNKTTNTVPAIGLAKAEKIFYRALTTYFTSSTNFANARVGTAQAAQDLYGATEKAAIEQAWCAVGVGSCSGGGTGGSALTNGVAKTGISASTGSDVVFTLDVPSGASNISFVMSGGTGDADMYVKFGSTPTDSSYDCRPYKTGNNETCTGTQTGGKYYVRIKAYSSFSGVSLTGSFTAGSGGGNQVIEQVNSNVSVSRGAWKHYTITLPSGYSKLTVTTTGGSGDADLYVRQGSRPTSSSYNCRPYKNGNEETCTFTNPAGTTWHYSVYGYSAVSGLKITARADP